MVEVPTKFNKTGKRILTDPYNDKLVCAPANRRYRQSCKAIMDKFERNKDKPLKEYIEKMSQVIASYVGSESASDEDRYRIIKFLAEGGLSEYAEKPPLGDISGLSQMVQEAWQKYNEACGKLWKERDEALKRASYEHDDMKRALRREISDYFHHQFHPEDDKPNS